MSHLCRKKKPNLCSMGLLFIIFVFGNNGVVLAQDKSSLSFFPLKIGNTWITGDFSALEPVYFKHQVIDTIRIDNKLYYEVGLYGSRFFREDSLERFYEFKDGTEQVIMDFSMSVGDSIPISSGYTYCFGRKEVETFIGTQDEEIHFMLDWDSIIIDDEQTFILQRGVGIFFFKVAFPLSPEYLVGAVINGVVYGDTTVVSVEKVQKDIPQSFSLSQNFPNPFNPSTTIRFELPKASYIKLKVYNLLGEEVEILVDEFRSPGIYEIKWAPEGLSNGLYFYQIKANGFVESRKLLMVK